MGSRNAVLRRSAHPPPLALPGAGTVRKKLDALMQAVQYFRRSPDRAIGVETRPGNSQTAGSLYVQ
jgi:hypothetical protein